VEPFSEIALSVALGAGISAGKELVNDLVKDAYATVKKLLKKRYPNVSLEKLEQIPASKNVQMVVEKELSDYGAGQDAELAVAAHNLIKLIHQYAPAAAFTIGVDLKDVAAVNLRLADIAASGTGVKVERGTFAGDIDIRGVSGGLTSGLVKSG
jgi:hypothetical protein